MTTTVWTEEHIESLPKEDNTFDRKASRLFDLSDGNKVDNFRNDLAKALSAFANTGGGSIILGVDDEGEIDGGIPLIARGRQATKDYLENIIPNLTDPEIIGCRVVELPRQGDRSKIDVDKAVYIIEVPDSDRAPHQSERDLKYYVRLGSNSQPAPHRMIEDIRNRTRHPKLEVSAIVITHAEYFAPPGSLRLRLEISIRNVSRMRAANSCLALSASVPLALSAIAAEQGEKRGGTVPGIGSIELARTVYPDMGLVITPVIVLQAELTRPGRPIAGPGTDLTIQQWASLTVGNEPWEEATISTTLYADSAPACVQKFTLGLIDSSRIVERFLRANS